MAGTQAALPPVLLAWVGGVLGDKPVMEADSAVTASEHTRDMKIASLGSTGLLAQLAPCGSWPQASAKPLGHRINSPFAQPLLPLSARGEGESPVCPGQCSANQPALALLNPDPISSNRLTSLSLSLPFCEMGTKSASYSCWALNEFTYMKRVRQQVCFE